MTPPTVALLVASVPHRRSLKALRDQCPDLPGSLAGVTVVLLAWLGLLALVGAILRQ
jgi:hypothetical protein